MHSQEKIRFGSIKTKMSYLRIFHNKKYIGKNENDTLTDIHLYNYAYQMSYNEFE